MNYPLPKVANHPSFSEGSIRERPIMSTRAGFSGRAGRCLDLGEGEEMRIRIKLLFKAVLTIFLITSLTSEPQSFAADDNQSTIVPLKTDVKGLKALEGVIVSFKDDLSEEN